MIEVRQLAVADWELWREVRLAALADAPEAYSATLAEWVAADDDRWRARITDVPYNAVAFVDGAPVGQASGTAPRDTGETELISMWVAPTARGCGVSDALIDAVVAWAETQPVPGVVLWAYRTNAAAIATYERNRFVADESGSDAELLQLRRAFRS
jgi:GNAT superfamily N-acetyltransferase